MITGEALFLSERLQRETKRKGDIGSLAQKLQTVLSLICTVLGDRDGPSKMAKKQTIQRDFSTPTQSLASLLAYQLRPAPVLLPVPTTITQYDVLAAGDRRLFRPDESTRPPSTPKPGSSRVVVGKTLNAVRFTEPKMVSICVRRKIRKEVIFALGKRKKGSSSGKRKNFWSSVSC